MFAVSSGVALLDEHTPTSYREAMASPDARKWRAAAQAEFDGCVAQETWELVPRETLPRSTNIIPVKWVFKIKTDENGVVIKHKARITPKGFKQRHGVDYFEVFANTGKYKTLRVALSIAARRDLELRQLDVPQAFTQAVLEEDVYMEMPEGFEVDGMVCHLKKSLYGLKQSPRNWLAAWLAGQLGWKPQGQPMNLPAIPIVRCWRGSRARLVTSPSTSSPGPFRRAYLPRPGSRG